MPTNAALGEQGLVSPLFPNSALAPAQNIQNIFGMAPGIWTRNASLSMINSIHNAWGRVYKHTHAHTAAVWQIMQSICSIFSFEINAQFD